MSKLYIIGSPIGNLEDITIRAVDILKNLDYVFSEDTRISSKLVKKFDISTLLIPIYTSKKELGKEGISWFDKDNACLLYTSPSPRDATLSRLPSSA